jgi:hypothetical protein
MAFRLPDNSAGPGAAQQLLSVHLGRAKETHAKFNDATGPGYIGGSPVKTGRHPEFDETGAPAEFHQAARDPDNFGYFGDFLSRFREFDRQGDAGEDFA